MSFLFFFFFVTIFIKHRVSPEFEKYSIVRKYASVKQLDVRQRFNCYIVSGKTTMEQINGKCIIQLGFVYKMFSNHVVNCGTNFLTPFTSSSKT